MSPSKIARTLFIAVIVGLVPVSAAAHGPHVEPVQPQPVGPVERVDPNEGRVDSRRQQQVRGGGCASCAIGQRSTVPVGGALFGAGLAAAMWVRLRLRRRNRS